MNICHMSLSYIITKYKRRNTNLHKDYPESEAKIRKKRRSKPVQRHVPTMSAFVTRHNFHPIVFRTWKLI